ncbi:hypothetical protein [Mumia sp. DW29H23]|uniref:hypothetical protein n=1 Tax=Mumia sp. DW29H23 TaxID=3421241 RepID=UPI003D698A02
MPRAHKRCSDPTCDNRMPCPAHKPPDRRPSRHHRGYGNDHDDRAAALRRQAASKQLPCALCNKPIDYTLRAPHPHSFAAHHTTRDKAGPIVQAHKRCNEIAGQPDA